jgi:hypothetical protein
MIFSKRNYTKIGTLKEKFFERACFWFSHDENMDSESAAGVRPLFPE